MVLRKSSVDNDNDFRHNINLHLVTQIPILLSTDRTPVVGQEINLYEGTDVSKKRNEHTDVTVSIIAPWSFSLWRRRKTLATSLQSYIEFEVEKNLGYDNRRNVDVILHLSRPTLVASTMSKEPVSLANRTSTQ